MSRTSPIREATLKAAKNAIDKVDRLSEGRRRIKEMRPVSRRNADGTTSNVVMASGEGRDEWGKPRYYAHPTIFPRPDATEDPSTWDEMPGDEAYREAMRRNEVFHFPTEEEAQEFAKGSWKKIK